MASMLVGNVPYVVWYNFSIFDALLKSDWSDDDITRACMPLYDTMVIAANTAIITTTISSSTMVNPRLFVVLCTTVSGVLARRGRPLLVNVWITMLIIN